MITIFTPSFADESDTNAQNLTVKEIVSRLDPGKFHVTMLTEGAPDTRISGRANTRILRWRARGNTVRILWRLLHDRPDIYFFPREGPLDALFLRMRHHLGLRTALVAYVVSGGELENGQPRSTLERNIRESDVVVGNSIHMTDLLRSRMAVNAETVHDGVDRRYFFPRPSKGEDSNDKKLIVLFAGSLRAYKRPDLVVEQAVRWPAVEFRIAGKGEELENCRQLAEHHKCRNVKFLGHLPSQQVGEEMRQADIFFFPSIVEGHPQVLVQAAACGLPVVAMKSYQPDFVVDGETGFLADSDDDLVRNLDRLLTGPDLRQSMGEAATRHAQRFDWDASTAEWQRIFDHAIQSRTRR